MTPVSTLREVHPGAGGALPGGIPPTPSRAPLGTARLLSGQAGEPRGFRLDRGERPAVAFLKAICAPTAVVAVLNLCQFAAGVHASAQWLPLDLLVLLAANRILSTPSSSAGARGQTRVRPNFPRLLVEWCGLFAVLDFFASGFALTDLMPRDVLISWFMVTPAALILTNFGTLRLARWLSARRPYHVRHIIIGATDVGIELARRVEQDAAHGLFMGFFDFRHRARLPEGASQRWQGSCSDVVDFVRSQGIQAIYIALPNLAAPRIAELLQQLRDTTASVYFVPDVLAFDLVQPLCIEIHGIPALAVCETPFRGMSALRKRAMDIAFASAALALAAPLMLVIALAVKLSSRGPVLFKQRRYGLHGEEIHVYKFRSMRVCEDGAVVSQATRDDQRVTRVGRFLRRTSLDELPQILNVLEGAMSLVGPRPHAVAHNEQYRRLISGYMIRHKVRPGITGWAQVNGLRGETSTVEKMQARIQFDIDYIKNWSLLLDLRILLRTALLIFRDEHAY